MLHFNDLRITPDGSQLLINVSIDSQDYFNDVTLDRIIIDTQDTYVPNGPSSNPIYDFQIESMENRKNIILSLSPQELGVLFCKTLFFVYAIAKGESSPETPCDINSAIILGSVVDLSNIYKQIIQYLKELDNECEVPKGYINMLLRFKAIDLCVRTGNYTQAIKYWKKFFMKSSCVSKPSNCGCHG